MDLINRLRRLARDDAGELTKVLADERIPHSAREAIEALQQACADAAQFIERSQSEHREL